MGLASLQTQACLNFFSGSLPLLRGVQCNDVMHGCLLAEADVTLIAHKISESDLERLLSSSDAAAELASCDVAAFVFDSSSPESFRETHIAMMRAAEASGNSLPCMLIAAKDDLTMPPVRLIAGE